MKPHKRGFSHFSDRLHLSLLAAPSVSFIVFFHLSLVTNLNPLEISFFFDQKAASQTSTLDPSLVFRKRAFFLLKPFSDS